MEKGKKVISILKPNWDEIIFEKKDYSYFTNERVDTVYDNEWESLKKEYNYRCVTCDSVEGEFNIHYPNITTKLQKGHIDPEKPLKGDNVGAVKK